ncbi:hypothetical protein EFM24_09240 [Limosilactobacillus fermentum]|uniref:virulence-associated E family protein n=1 Tax=Limosilactobacillus fermentum TaxID=1613 RepID=UPI0021A2F58F|nr:virulence-associated E family protein [Limosilactobacillus fermentum]MCT2875862.1 hypothetical protein [Limosilactobacillus fermentum]
MNNLIKLAKNQLNQKEQQERTAPFDGQGNQEKPRTWTNALVFTEKGGVNTRAISNVSLFIEHDKYLSGKFHQNEFTDNVEVDTINVPGSKDKTKDQLNGHYIRGFYYESGELRDILANQIKEYFEQKKKIAFSEEAVRKSIINLAADPGNAFNPVKKRVESVHWDGNERMANYFVKYLEAEDSDYTREVTTTWFMGMMDRLYNPGGKFEVVPILEGEQGIGKSTVAAQLCPDYFTDSLSTLGDFKDDYLTVGSNWIIELGELSSMNATTTEKVKNFISARKDDIRDPYGHQPYPHKRKCVFIGTTNEHKYLKDETGNRRFYPIQCLRKQGEGPIPAVETDILQILAEAKVRYEEARKNASLTEALTISRKFLKIATEKQQAAKADNPIENTLDAYLNLLVPCNWDRWTYTNKRAFFEYFSDPANGFDVSNEEARKQALQNYVDVFDYSRSEALMGALEGSLEHMKRVQTQELLVVALNMPKQSSKGKIEGRILKRLMDNKEGWEYKQFKVRGQKVRGYVYTTNIQ